MPTLECAVEDQDKKFQIMLDEVPRVGEYLSRGGTTYVIASVTWEISRRAPAVRLVIRELPPAP